MRILITGATGFVGSNLTHYFIDQGYSVTVTVRDSSSFYNLKDINDKIDTILYDGTITSLKKGIKDKNIDTVLHLASLFIAEHKTDDIDNLITSNILFGTQLLEAMKVCGVKKIINTGTSWQYYHQETYNPVSLYAATKHAFSNILEYYIQAEGFKAIDLILYDTYGENDNRGKLINLLHQFSDSKKVLDMSKGEQRLYFVHISDVCYAYKVALTLLDKTNTTHPIYSVRGNINYSLKEMVYLFEQVTGKNLKINWGKRAYRKREVMNPFSVGQIMPNWESKISLAEGLKLLHQSD
ncbi:NAD-dependent epimerase/dehydratase family protein [Halosquirtibacter xylanolyticus]|uniref:NAD-dependent epimerase/dehydratase family protein n=1 Tax=Halosquirtibacter xylanolyticus TaxID=3374599 RepID=UPI0037479B2A|nr:NAD-dependent epimerase/dehydratase family protein [Prolixibacteraceae bacterium]